MFELHSDGRTPACKGLRFHVEKEKEKTMEGF